ncbi:DeoR/GlpR family DNA-binding transcription regulator [Salinicoccus roseus]|uniref:DeoR/GlpR family DNA-binding transcription regulator n=1 Tax=Salinicoccus roseus TaxID=45670 RepID=UPI003524C580
MKPFERRKALLNTLYINNMVNVNELSKEFNVSEETIRRDLEKLEKEGVVERTYGGATLVQNRELPYSVRHNRNISSKVKIAKKINKIIENNQTLFTDSSSTVHESLKQLAISDKKIHVITNAVNALSELNQSSIEITSTGGKLLKHSSALVGPLTTQTISKFRPEYALISCKSLSADGEISDSNEYEAHIKELMINRAEKVILTIDSSKFYTNSLIKFAELKDINYIVSDKESYDQHLNEMFNHHGIEIIQ